MPGTDAPSTPMTAGEEAETIWDVAAMAKQLAELTATATPLLTELHDALLRIAALQQDATR